MRAQLTPEATADVTEARDWYQRRRPGLGRALTDAINETIERIQERPESLPRVHGENRRALVRQFPYAIYYRIDGEVIVVLACVHGARDPEVWQRRID